MGKVHPSVLEEPAPIAQNTFNRQACIKLHAKRVKNQAKIHREVCESGFMYLESMTALMNGHREADLWVELCGDMAD